MADLIDRQALGIGRAKRDAFENPAYADGWNSAIEIIKNAPTIEAEPVKHGRWVSQCCYNTCSACGVSICMWDDDGYIQNFAYCPKCGAKMDGKEQK